MGERLTRADELMLLGDLEGFCRHMLQQVRSARTQARNALAQAEMLLEREAAHGVPVRKLVPRGWVGGGDVGGDFGFVPTAADLLREMAMAPWMVRGGRRLSRELEGGDADGQAGARRTATGNTD